VNQFIQAVYLARSEAIKRNGVVSLCPSLDGESLRPGRHALAAGLDRVRQPDRDSPAVRRRREAVGACCASIRPVAGRHRCTANRTTLSFRPFGQMGVTATFTFCDDRGSPRRAGP
jgi:Tfp pilus assembly protein FimT